MIDKGAECFKRQEEANKWCSVSIHFRPTSLHRNWQGKVKCSWCRVSGWVDDPQSNSYHWTHKHGAKCKKRPSIATGGYIRTISTTNPYYTFNNVTTNTSSSYIIPWGTLTYNLNSPSAYVTITGV